MVKHRTLREHIENKCANFNGLMNKRCDAGVCYADVKTKGVSPVLLPCLRGDLGFHPGKNIPDCDKRRWLTEEEIQAEEDRINAAVSQVIERINGNICVVCGVDIANKRQVGRCVYADPCGHRQYQGTVE